MEKFTIFPENKKNWATNVFYWGFVVGVRRIYRIFARHKESRRHEAVTHYIY